MPIDQKFHRFQVRVNRASADKGYRRIAKSCKSREEAERLEREINLALDAYGHWPVREGAVPIAVPNELYAQAAARSYRNPAYRTGTLREAAILALNTHWKGMRYHPTVDGFMYPLISFFEDLGKIHLDDITSADLDAFVARCRARGNAPSYINQQIGALRIVNKLALKRLPPLATVLLPMPYVKGGKTEKWWLRPEAREEVTKLLRGPNVVLAEDAMFADLIDIICFQGLRVEEALRLEERQFRGLDGDKPWLQPDGTKTHDAGNSIPVFPESIPIIKSAILRARSNRWDRLFPITPREASDRWNNVRAYLGVDHIPTATMKSLRRTFAWYANHRGMPTATLQKVLRHRSITTTSGYLDLIGSGEVENSRKYFVDDTTQVPPVAPTSSVGDLIRAYRDAGATPEEVARFAKEMML